MLNSVLFYENVLGIPTADDSCVRDLPTEDGSATPAAAAAVVELVLEPLFGSSLGGEALLRV